MRHLPECLETLAKQDITEPFETIVVDNGSIDESVAYIRMTHPTVKLVQNSSNLGFAAACNAGIRASTGEYIVLLNNDTKAPPEWLRELVKAADGAAPDIFAVGSVLMLYHHPERLNSTGALFSPMGGGFDLGLGEDAKGSNVSAEPYRTAIAPGAAVLYKRDLYNALGGLDDRFFLYFEDVELCYRAWKKGYGCLMAPAARIFHKHGGTAGPRDSPERIYWGQRNRFRSIGRNQSGKTLLRSIAFLFAYTGYKTLSIIMHGPRESFVPLWKATAEGIGDYGRYRHEYKAERADAKRSDDDMAEAGLVATVRDVVTEGDRIKRLEESGIRV